MRRYQSVNGKIHWINMLNNKFVDVRTFIMRVCFDFMCVRCAMCIHSCNQLSASPSIISMHSLTHSLTQRRRGKKQAINIIKLYLTRHEHFDNRIYIGFQFDACIHSVHCSHSFYCSVCKIRNIKKKIPSTFSAHISCFG